jgi:hypothetical protein
VELRKSIQNLRGQKCLANTRKSTAFDSTTSGGGPNPETKNRPMSRLATSDRKLRSQKALEDEAGNESDDAEVSFRTTAGSRLSSTSEENENLESTLNPEKDNNLNMRVDGGDEIELLDTETVRVDVTGPEERARTAMDATAKAFTPAATLPTPAAPVPPASNFCHQEHLLMQVCS